MKAIKLFIAFSIVMSLALLSVGMTSCKSSPSTQPTTKPTIPTSTSSTTTTSSTNISSSITINLVAQNMAFNTSSITVHTGASVTVNFNNKDAGIPHNFAVYQTLSGGQTKPVFIGTTITGPVTTTYTFTAPSSAGTYFFECDVHPSQMNGQFILSP